jgi:hypothetical protein
MSTAASVKTATPSGLFPSIFPRVIAEGYGSGAWHGPDLKAALSDVTAELAFWRPAPDRHNIAEIALHHAYFVHGVTAQLSGATPKPFIVDGQDWFELSGSGRLTWPKIRDTVESEQRALAKAVEHLAAGRFPQPALEVEPFDLVLGITCHAIYHAGQVQLIKKLAENAMTK